MARAFVTRKFGDVGVLKLEKIEVADPNEGEAQIEQTAVGVNHIDIHYRKGNYYPGAFPNVLGMEGIGVVTKLGPNTKYVKVGDKVAYGTGVLGGYSTIRNIPADLLLPIPSGVNEYQILAACMKGLFANVLVAKVAIIHPGSSVLVHGAAGGVGHLLVQMARYHNMRVIGTVDSEEKAEFAKKIGCNLVINTKIRSFSKAVLDYTDGYGVNVIFDSLGRKAYQGNVKAIAPMGILMIYGDVLGSVTSLDLLKLWDKSIMISRPCLATQTAKRSELVIGYTMIANMIREGKLVPKYSVYEFNEIPAIQAIIEKGLFLGSHIAKI